MFLNALTKLVYSTIRAKYNIGTGNGKKARAVKPKRNGRKKDSEESSDSVSEFEENFVSEYDSDLLDSFHLFYNVFRGFRRVYDSDDSEIIASKAKMNKILAGLELRSILSVCLALVSKPYIKDNAMYKLDSEKSVELLGRLLYV